MKDYKKDFPIFKNNSGLIYLDSGATSQKPQVVIDSIVEFYSAYNANIHRGIYPIAEKATEKVEEVRIKVTNFIHAKDPSEIIFTKSATEATNLVMYAWGKENIKKDDIVMTTLMEHHANFVPWQILSAEKEALFDVVNITTDGYIDEKQLLEDAKSAKFLAITLLSNMLGTIVPLARIIKEIRRNNKEIKILVDAAQAAPHMKIDVQSLDCDFLVFSGHKMLAGTGIGILYAKKNILEDMNPYIFGGDMIREVSIERTTFADLPSKFEGGTLHIAGIISLGTAIDYLENIGMEKMQKYEQELLTYCVEQMNTIDGLRMYGPENIAERGGLVSFTIKGIHPHDIAQILADENICVRSGHHCTMPLHTHLGIPASVRASFYLYNSDEDIDLLVKGLLKAKNIFKK